MNPRIKAQIETVIEAARELQAEAGGDRDYWQAAKENLDKEKRKLEAMIDQTTTPKGKS